MRRFYKDPDPAGGLQWWDEDENYCCNLILSKSCRCGVKLSAEGDTKPRQPTVNNAAKLKTNV